MSHKKTFTAIVVVLAIICATLPGQMAQAQSSLFIEALYPQQGSPGEVVSLLLRGSGFESVVALNGVAISGREVPALDYELLSDEAAEVRILIPEDMPLGETEITFVFDGFGFDAFFIISENTPSPLAAISPREGQVDSQISLLFEVSNIFLGGFGGITLRGVDLPVIGYEVNDSGESWQFLIYLPPDLPAGEAEIRLYFENYSFSSPFFIFAPEFDQPPAAPIYGFAPHEGPLDTEIQMVLEGENLFEVGDLIGLTIAGIEVPVLDYAIESNQIAVARVYLPPELPTGENRIAFFFESNLTYTDIFFAAPREPVGGDEQVRPVLQSLSPQDGKLDSDIELFLEGENLSALGELAGVWISAFPLQDYGYELVSENEAVIYAYLPANAPAGDQSISVAFENAEISQYFFVSQPPAPSFPLWAIAVIGIVGIFGAGVVIGGGILIVRAVRGSRPPQKQPEEPAHRRPSGIEFKVVVDPGIQTIEPAGESLSAGIDLRFVVIGDPGEQEIGTNGDRLADEQ